MRYEGVSLKRIEHGEIARDIILENEIAFARHRAKPIFTGWEIRKRIVDELRERPEEFKQRSLRRRLTKLDRALSDEQAFALDMAFTAWLILNGKSKSVDAGAINAASGPSHKIPLNQREFETVALFQAAISGWPMAKRRQLEGLFQLMAPWAERQDIKPDERSIRQVVELAEMLRKKY